LPDDNKESVARAELPFGGKSTVSGFLLEKLLLLLLLEEDWGDNNILEDVKVGREGKGSRLAEMLEFDNGGKWLLVELFIPTPPFKLLPLSIPVREWLRLRNTPSLFPILLLMSCAGDFWGLLE